MRRLLHFARLLAAALLCAAAHAAPLRVASGFDPQTMDPHGLALLYHTRVMTQVYESLVWRDQQYRLEPGLAVSWQPVDTKTWRFKLRPGVKFHDGSAFTADDAVFSIQRALAPPSKRSFQLKGVVGAKKVDDLTIDVSLSTPDAVLPEKFFLIAMVSKTWCLRHGVERAQDFDGKQETYAVRNANGTGPFRLERYEPDVKVVLKSHPGWWGRADKRSGNVDEAVYVSVKSDATRLAALASGEVDLVLDPPFQDVERLMANKQLTLLQIPDLGQQYLTFDQSRDELVHGDVKDRNPFKDKRVRQAVYQAINVDLIVSKVLRGQATPTGALLSTKVDGAPTDHDKRLPYDPQAAKALLAAAGYPGGFAVTLDCVNIAYRENVCQAATAMLAQVGIRTTLRSAPTNQFFPKLSQATASFIEFGWTPAIDAWASLNALFHTWDKDGGGTFNAGRYSNAAIDKLIDDIRVEPDLTRRRAMVATSLRLLRDELVYIPLYRRTLTWAMNKRVRAVQWPSDTLELRWVQVQQP
ncbi:ABC transporter substrate-binding protein [Piscinibacter sp. XHJ-5]|uniref:ABC transporter substrate-binding protein n=1 Tax=Piscinibacter sp. XHJ-5 TaxID=3037797 RepID=UPI0024530EDE|nr:ABC transporter substrate-binding protein [Piscinibacter sp. XHJ-5]